MNKIFRLCKLCEKIILPYTSVKRGYHKACFDLEFICKTCQKEIPSGHKRAQGDGNEANYCSCYKAVAIGTCPYCHLVIAQGELLETADGRCHQACHARFNVCHICRKLVETKEEKVFDDGMRALHIVCSEEKKRKEPETRREKKIVDAVHAEIDSAYGDVRNLFPNSSTIQKEVDKVIAVLIKAEDARRKTLISLSKPGWQWELMFPKPGKSDE